MRTILIALLLFASVARCSCQTQDIDPHSRTAFDLTFTVVGIGDTAGEMLPVVKINHTYLTYTLEQTNRKWVREKSGDSIFLVKESVKDPIPVLTATITMAAIDSMMKAIEGVKGKVERKCPVTKSATLWFIRVERGSTKVEFTLTNSSEPHVAKLVAILNRYFPADKQLWLAETECPN